MMILLNQIIKVSLSMRNERPKAMNDRLSACPVYFNGYCFLEFLGKSMEFAMIRSISPNLPGDQGFRREEKRSGKDTLKSLDCRE
jgi:hypothetical protein